MVATQRTKVIDKPDLIKKVLALLKKTYSGTPLKPELPVLETLMYGVCLENTSPEMAEQGYARLLNGFQDLNEVRVSSIYELERVFHDMEQPEWRALRIKNILQYLFETTYSFDFDSLKRKTHELATKQLSKIKSLSTFVRAFVQQNALGSHILPIDDRMQRTLVWLGLAELEASPEQTAEAMRSFVRKAEGQLFCHLIRCLATDRKYAAVFSSPKPVDADLGTAAAYERLENLIRHGPPTGRKDGAKKQTPDKHASEKHPEKQTAAKSSAEKRTGDKEKGEATRELNGAKKGDGKKSSKPKEKVAKAAPKKVKAASAKSAQKKAK